MLCCFATLPDNIIGGLVWQKQENLFLVMVYLGRDRITLPIELQKWRCDQPGFICFLRMGLAYWYSDFTVSWSSRFSIVYNFTTAQNYKPFLFHCKNCNQLNIVNSINSSLGVIDKIAGSFKKFKVGLSQETSILLSILLCKHLRVHYFFSGWNCINTLKASLYCKL